MTNPGSDGLPYEKRADGKGEAECIEKEIPFELPEGWAWARLGFIGDWKSGATPKKSRSDYYDGGNIPWLLTGDLNDGHVSNIPHVITKLALEECSVRLNPIGSILVAMYGATIGKIGILDKPATTNQACCACILHEEEMSRWLVKWLLFYKPTFMRLGLGGAQPNISRDIIVSRIVPIPPLAEQRRIVAALDKYLALVDEIERNQADLESLFAQLKSKVLDLAIRGELTERDPGDEPASELLAHIHEEKLAMVERGELKPKDAKGDTAIYTGSDGLRYEKPADGNGEPKCIEKEIPFELPEGWAWTRLLTPVALDPKNSAPDDTDASFLPMAAIDDGFSNSYHPEVRPWGKIKKGYTQFADGDVVFAKISPCFENGKYFIAHNLENGIGAGTTELYVLRSPKVGVDKEYLFRFLASRYFTEGAVKTFMGSVGQQRIKKDYLEGMLLPVPPLAEQRRIVERIEDIFMLVD